MYSSPAVAAAAALSLSFSSSVSAFAVSSSGACALSYSAAHHQLHGRSHPCLYPQQQCRLSLFSTSATTTTTSSSANGSAGGEAAETHQANDSADINNDEWKDVLPLVKGSHNSARLEIPAVSTSSVSSSDEQDEKDPFAADTFRDRLEATLQACRELGKTSLWVQVPMQRASLMECMGEFGLQFHHAHGQTAVLNVWLKADSDNKIPEFATHNVGVGAVVVNSRDEILCVRELRKNYLPWKTPTGLTELGEHIAEAAVREVLEETGIATEFHSILSFRQTHGLTHGRSDLFFVCRLDPVERLDDETGRPVIPEPVPQENEIEKAEWVKMADYRTMVSGATGGGGHPMMKHVIDVYDAGKRIEKRVVDSVVPGRKPNDIYLPSISSTNHGDR